MYGCESEKVPRMPKNAIKSSKIVFKERAAPSSVRKRHAASSLTRLSIVGKKDIKCSAPVVKILYILYSRSMHFSRKVGAFGVVEKVWCVRNNLSDHLWGDEHG